MPKMQFDTMTDRVKELAPIAYNKIIQHNYTFQAACNSVGISATSLKKWCLYYKMPIKVKKKGHSRCSPWHGYKTASEIKAT